MTFVSRGVIRSALHHLSVDRCPRCLNGDLHIDIDRVSIACSRRCIGVARAVGECAKALTGKYAGERSSLKAFTDACTRNGDTECRSLDSIYTATCMLPPSETRTRILEMLR